MNTLKELLFDIGTFAVSILRKLLNWFLELSFFNKIVVMNSTVAFFAIVMPMARYFIYESWNYINNPMAVYLIGIVAIMTATVYMPNLYGFIIRIVVNSWYLLWLLFLASTRGISHAPYELTMGFYMNIIAPSIFIVAACLQYLIRDRN